MTRSEPSTKDEKKGSQAEGKEAPGKCSGETLAECRAEPYCIEKKEKNRSKHG